MRISLGFVSASSLVLVLAAGCGGSEEGGGSGGGNGSSSAMSSASSTDTTTCNACANAAACCQAGVNSFHLDAGGACTSFSVASCNAAGANQATYIQDCNTEIQTGKALGLAACH